MLTTTTFKPINLANAMDAFKNLCAAESHTAFEKKMVTDHPQSVSFAAELERAKANEDFARTSWTAHSADLENALIDTQKDARVRTITAEDICDDLSEVETHLRISKSAMKGVTVTINHHAQTFPNAYKRKGNPESTYFTAEHNGKNWRLTGIYRDTCLATKARISLTDEAKAAVIRNAETF